MIQKGRTNNKSLYLLLAAVMLVLAGTAYGAFYLLFGGETVAKEEPAPAVKAVVEAPQPKADAPKTNNGIAVAHAEVKEHNYSILIKKSEFKLRVFDNGAQVEEFGCALGKNTGDKERSGDMKTPNGTFKVIEICDASWWTHDFKDGKGEIKGAYGPWFFYLDTNAKSKGQWDGIGIHGTHDPASIGTLASEGCIRLLNENVQLLKDKYIKVGTMVTIEE